MYVCVRMRLCVHVCVYAYVYTYKNVLFFVLSVNYLEHQVIIMIATLALVIFSLLIRWNSSNDFRFSSISGSLYS